MSKSLKSRSPIKARRWRVNRRLRRGAALVEFAFVVPVFILMIFTCFDFARLCMMSNLAQDAAYEAARYAMVPGSTSEEATDRANAVLARLGTRNASIVVNDDQALTENTSSVKVVVNIPMNQNSFGLTYFMTDKVLSSEVTLIAERYNGFYDATQSN